MLAVGREYREGDSVAAVQGVKSVLQGVVAGDLFDGLGERADGAVRIPVVHHGVGQGASGDNADEVALTVEHR